MIFLSPAKVNLTLDITGKDEKDGYHFIDSIFDPVSLFDIMDVKKISSNSIRIRQSGTKLDIKGRDNIVYKAVRLMKETYNIKSGFSIKLQKNIPSGAGLGGGSSNAATVLHAVNETCNLKLSNAQLSRLGTKLGSDVPFFVYNRPARVTGKGEKITFLKRKGIFWYVLVKKNVHISTKNAYSMLDDKLGLTGGKSYNKLNNERTRLNLEFRNIKLNNIFESVIFGRVHKLKVLKNELSKLSGNCALMSGSGATVFALFETKEDAEACYQGVKKRFVRDFVYLAHSL